jgi:hypothetical protein
MSNSWLGHSLNDEPLQSRTGSEQKDPNGPPPTEQETSEAAHLKSKPHHLEARLTNLEPEMRELFEKTMADKVNAERRAKEHSERLARTEAKLNEIAQREQEAERKRLEEQGAFKELAAKHEARAAELEEKLFKVQVHSSLERELANAGVADAEMASEFVLNRYGEELRSNPSAVLDVVDRLKTSKPHLFKQSEPEPQPPAAPQAPTQRSSGLQTPTPPAGQPASQFNAADKRIPIAEVERQWKEATKNAKFFNP